jgi:Glycosyltransferase family 87
MISYETPQPNRQNLMMAQHDHRRLYSLVALYAFLAVGWAAVAVWVVPPLLAAERSGRVAAALKHYLHIFATPYLARDTAGRWRELAGAVLIAIILHLTIVLTLRQFDLRAAIGRSSPDARVDRRVSFWLTIISLVFLTVTVVCGPIHDYYFYLQMWYEVRQGHDPWFFVVGANGNVPLNAYGPLFNLLAGPAWIVPLAPKLLFAHTYILFAVWHIKSLTSSRRPSAVSMVMLTALFWNPFPWVEIAIRGHFDILVALFCLGAIRAWARGHDFPSANCLALGVLLKYFPVVLLPFLALDRGRLRVRFLILAVVTIALGLGLSFAFWGPTMYSPLNFVATRRSECLSIFRFIRGLYSPIQRFIDPPGIDQLAPVVMFVAVLRAWSWYRVGHSDIESACVVAVTTTALLYQTGFPQYHMLPFALGASWTVRYWDVLRGQVARGIAIGSYFGWLAGFDVYYLIIDDRSPFYLTVVEEIIGLPTFVVGCAFLAAVVLSARREDQRVIDGPESGGAVGSGAASPA